MGPQGLHYIVTSRWRRKYYALFIVSLLRGRIAYIPQYCVKSAIRGRLMSDFLEKFKAMVKTQKRKMDKLKIEIEGCSHNE